MAQQDRFYVGMVDPNASLQTNLKPFAIPDTAFASLTNAYIFRGRVRKRFGARLMQGTTANISGLEQIQSRLKINLGNTNGSGGFSATAPGAIFGIGQAFSVGSAFFTVYQTGTPAALNSTTAATGTYNTSTGALIIAGAAISTAVYFYPASPVMGLITYDQTGINVEDVVAFDRQFAYQFASNGWDRLGTAVWTGNDSKFFWGYNARGSSAASTYLYITNYNYGTTSANSDPIYYWDGSSWTALTPSFNSGVATDLIMTCRIIVAFKNRLVLLNIVENTGGGAGTNAVYVNRARYSWIGDPTNSAAFYDDVAGSGGYIDAPTKEAIVTAQFLKDRLIVYFESSTWELAYTGNQVEPFVWQQINTELGAESTFSQVPFDKVVLGIGNVGIHACNGSNVDRIDEKIPDAVFEIHNDDNGVERVSGIRDYFAEMVYWSFPGINRSSSYPYNNRVLTYNYKNGSWAFNDDSITTFGYFQTTVGGTSSSPKWGALDTAWEEAAFTWQSPTLQAKFRNVIAGNQEGYTFIVDPTVTFNSPAIQITNLASSTLQTIITAINHNFEPGDFIKIENCVGITTLNGLIFKVIDRDQNTITINATISGTYLGAGTITRVTPVDFKTKQFNFYAQQGRNAYISKVDFLVDRTDAGQCTVDFLISSSDQDMLSQSSSTGALIGTSILETSPYTLVPYEAQQSQLWHPVYFLADGEYIQLHFYLSDTQATNVNIVESDFQLHALIFSAVPTTSRLQ